MYIRGLGKGEKRKPRGGWARVKSKQAQTNENTTYIEDACSLRMKHESQEEPTNRDFRSRQGTGSQNSCIHLPACLCLANRGIFFAYKPLVPSPSCSLIVTSLLEFS